MDNDEKMNELITETENLIKTIKTLKKEIESYEVAKNNLIEVKDKLANFNDKSVETNQLIVKYITELHNLVNSDLVKKVDVLIEQNNTEKVETLKTRKNLYYALGGVLFLNIVALILLIIK